MTTIILIYSASLLNVSSKRILGCEMTTLGSIYHDFPRLAKQSGFYFQLHTGRVNWSEIENLNVDEITEKRNYELLERNLINVINCNLEREYDLKILDPNFVKLFKLAQLGIDYLSYCEMYLDRCVILLQEQLMAFQEEYESLKEDNQKRREELNKSKRKNRTQSYQCEKCEKVFISDVYLKFHDKRRHSSPNTPNSSEILQKKFTDNSQQTEDGTKLSTSTQTLHLDVVTSPESFEEIESIKKGHAIKIEKLEEELKDLKESLKRAGSSLTEKVENSQLNQSNLLHPLNITGSMCCNSMLMLLPSYLKQSGSSYEINPGCQITVPEFFQSSVNPKLAQENLSLKIQEKYEPENKPELNTSLGKVFEKDLSKEENMSCKESVEFFPQYRNERKENLDYDKENIDPNLQKNNLTNLSKPLPPPRKLKKGIKTPSLTPSTKQVEAFTVVKKEINKEDTEGFRSLSTARRSTPIKEKSLDETDWEVHEVSKGNLSEINKPGSNSTESLSSRKSVSTDCESRSLFKRMIARNSPTLQRFSRNLKRSLTNLYDSVSSTEKDSKKRESSEYKKSVVVTRLSNRLRELGVDPEWKGIPKKTLKQKLNVLKHRRKLLSKENPMFPVIRQNLEEKVFQKIKNNLGRKKTVINKLSKQEPVAVEDPLQPISIGNIALKEKSGFMRVKKTLMYDTDTDTNSESKASNSECNFSHAPDQSTSQKSVVLEEFTSSDEEEKINGKKSKEFDFSVFQVGGGSLSSLTGDTQKNVSVNKRDELSDSDTDEDSVEHSEEKIFKTFNNHLDSNKDDEKREVTMNYENDEQQLEISHIKAESHGILKEEGPQSKLSTTAKKRVLFANYSDGIDEELSDSPVDDDLWPFKSDSEKDVG